MTIGQKKMTLLLARTAVCPVLGMLLLAGMAQAQGTRPVAFSVMLGAGYAPAYEGSNRSDTAALLDFNVSILDGTFFAGLSGIGYAPIHSDDLTLSVALGYGGGRSVKDDPANLQGLGDIDNEALGLVSGEYRFGQMALGADITAGRDYGVTAEVTLSTGVEVTDRITLGGEIGAIYADGDHMQQYFGVTAAQSAASGYGVFAPKGGIKSTGVGVTVSYAVTDSTAITLGARYDRLSGDAGDSPITRDRDQARAFLGISTQF